MKEFDGQGWLIDRVREMREKGVPIRTISKRLCVPEHVVNLLCRLHNLRLRFRPPTETSVDQDGWDGQAWLVDQVWTMRQQGHDLKKIAKTLRTTTGFISQLCKENGIPVRRMGSATRARKQKETKAYVPASPYYLPTPDKIKEETRKIQRAKGLPVR